jgi:uncharacterized membrane protein
MTTQDITTVFQWWFVLFIIGGIFFPLTATFFHTFTSKGYIFSKIIGIMLITYSMYILATLHILPFSIFSLLAIIVISLAINIFLYTKINFSWKSTHKNIALEEIIFLIALFAWSYIRAHEPSIHGLEKFMDYGFVNSILKSTYFPPKDMWYAGSTINYYYFGHIATAILTRLSFLPSFITFNLMIATLFALSITASFSLGINFISVKNFALSRKTVILGILAALLTTLGGNLHILYAFFTQYPANNPLPFWDLHFSPSTFPNSYWYPNATRFIPFTIHEFPSYSFVVSDLHGHVLDIPFVLLLIALLFTIFKSKKIKVRDSLLIGLLLSVAYMTNAWDAAIYLLLTGCIVVLVTRKKLTFHNLHKHKKIVGLIVAKKIENFNQFLWETGKHLLLIVGSFIIFSIPFSLTFDPPVSGIGVICAPHFLTKLGSIGPLLFEPNHCQHSVWWQLLTLYGFFYFFVVVFIIALWKRKRVEESDLFVGAMIIVSTLLLIMPEFIYVKDIYPQYFRANTMFKFAYQAFIMLSLSSAYIIVTVVKRSRNIFLIVFTALLVILVLIYPYFAVMSYYGNLTTYSGLNGLTYLKTSYPDDYSGIQWINTHIQGQPVLLEAQGDSYTDYERVSANTGLPTILGWTVHEWLWRKTYDVVAPRITEVKTIYEGTREQAIPLLKKYHVKYVYIGNLEHEKYPLLNQDKFRSLGKVVYKNPTVTIYQIDAKQLTQ